MSLLAVITGASRGIGAGLARAAEAGGAITASCSRSPAAVGERQLNADLADPTAWAVFADWYDALVEQQQPDRCVFVHNAATLTPIGFAGEVDPEAYRTNVLLNSAAPQVLGAAAIATARRTDTPTVIVQLTSGAGRSAYPGWSSYCAAKAAVDMWVRAVGLEQAERGDLVRALAVAPGVVATEMQAEIRSSDPSAFPNVERFRALHADGELADAAIIGARLWELAVSADWPNGTVADLRDLA
ncbi:MAG: SDR family NAD(P)-dependent oxidoreductase [Acidimicrobiia bacterium]|nr:SDR family NAD(P)-dependent oxidoreductase [Acidimicrobiia bacterium]